MSFFVCSSIHFALIICNLILFVITFFLLIRSLGHLKSYVRNKAAPEGCIAEWYIMEECLTFCSRYLENIETWFNRPRRNDDYNEVDSSEFDTLSRIFPSLGRPFGAAKIVSLDPFEKIQAHSYVLAQCELVDHFRE